MQFKKPKNDSKFHWTNHIFGKMIYYKISEGLVRRVIRSPHRVEEGIAPDTIAVMQKTGTEKNPKEIWVMYQKRNGKLYVITTWRYPGISPKRDSIPIPDNILEEILSDINLN